MKKWINHIFSRYLQRRSRDLDQFRRNPRKIQEQLLNGLISKAKHTEYGSIHDFKEIRSSKEFAKSVPLQRYEDVQPYIDRMMLGAVDILWPGSTKWFAKSSGTTGSKSKFIPITVDNLHQNHIKASWDSITLLYERRPNTHVFTNKNLIMGGSLHPFPANPEVHFGDVSAIMTHHMPMVGRPFYTPDFQTALLPDWKLKIERMAHISSTEDVTMFGGVPTWTIVLFKRILELTQKSNILEVWPNVQAYLHGGVGFEPYRKQFEEFIPSKDFVYHEIYNASEGFFAIQDTDEKELLLLLDHGIYYEFLPQSEWHSNHPIAIPLWEVERDVQYGLVVTTNSGLWRYIPGDTIKFTSTKPYRIQITGRMTQFINAFGEEIIVSNTDEAIAQTTKKYGAIVNDYTVAPVYINKNQKGRHQWVIEFESLPRNIGDFALQLDDQLQSINSDYEAKRQHDIAMEPLEIIPTKPGFFKNWLEQNGKLGGQYKVPRLCNNRQLMEEVLNHLESKNMHAC